MKKIFQTVLFAMSFLFFTTSCTTVNYNDEDEALGFGPVRCQITGGPCTCQDKFETDEDFRLHEEVKKDKK